VWRTDRCPAYIISITCAVLVYWRTLKTTFMQNPQSYSRHRQIWNSESCSISFIHRTLCCCYTVERRPQTTTTALLTTDTQRQVSWDGKNCTWNFTRGRLVSLSLSLPGDFKIQPECTHRVQTHAALLYSNTNHNPNPKTMSLLGYTKYQVWTLWDHSFLSYAADKQTNIQTDRQTNIRLLTFYPRHWNSRRE